MRFLQPNLHPDHRAKIDPLNRLRSLCFPRNAFLQLDSLTYFHCIPDFRPSSIREEMDTMIDLARESRSTARLEMFIGFCPRRTDLARFASAIERQEIASDRRRRRE
jgi:hypothetical protein